MAALTPPSQGPSHPLSSCTPEAPSLPDQVQQKAPLSQLHVSKGSPCWNGLCKAPELARIRASGNMCAWPAVPRITRALVLVQPHRAGKRAGRESFVRKAKKRLPGDYSPGSERPLWTGSRQSFWSCPLPTELCPDLESSPTDGMGGIPHSKLPQCPPHFTGIAHTFMPPSHRQTSARQGRGTSLTSPCYSNAWMPCKGRILLARLAFCRS